MNGWFYSKPGIVNDEQVGPVTSQDLLALAQAGKIKPTTLVIHANQTRNEWVEMKRLPAAMTAYRDGERQREEETHQQQLMKAEQVRQDRAAAMAEREAKYSQVRKFLNEDQDPDAVNRIYARVIDILTDQEEIEYIAVQKKPIVTIAPDCVVLTNRRVILFRPKPLGGWDMRDSKWLDIGDARIKEGIVGSTLTFFTVGGGQETIDYLPKRQARMLYRIAQQREEFVFELRRQRRMEETRAGASQVVINNQGAATPVAQPTDSAIPAQASSSSSGGGAAVDPVARLQQAQQMLQAGLITDDEFAEVKKKILGSL